MTHDSIEVVGARTHNLKDVSLQIRKDALTVFTGVSGSGKSSLVFDTIAVEAQRQLYGTFNGHIRNQLPRYERPDVDQLTGLTTPVIVDQRPVGGNARSTVGTMTDIGSLLRVLFSRCGRPKADALTFSFNDPASMCLDCKGLGATRRADVEAMLDSSKSLDDGAIQLPTHKVGSQDWQLYGTYRELDATKRIADYTAAERKTLLHGHGPKVTVKSKNGTMRLDYEGLVDRFERINLDRDLSGLSPRGRDAIERFLTQGQCPSCNGARLNATALKTKVAGKNLAQCSAMEISDLLELLEGIDDPVATPIAGSIGAGLRRIADVGLGYLTLDRATSTLSGGEGQRLKTVRHLGSTLVGVTYVFDEPSTGLHPHDVGRLNDLLCALREQGNTVLVVEHDPDVMEIADRIVDVGPSAGAAGGTIAFEGTFAQLRKAPTLTGKALRRSRCLKEQVREATGQLHLAGADLHNLKHVSVDIPTGVLTAVTGVAGSGKSTLVRDVFLRQHPDAIYVDQTPITASSRSTPATYLGLMDTVRKLFAQHSGAPASLFSANSDGACDDCQGRGVIITELAYMDPIATRCRSCQGRRYHNDVLAHQLDGQSIADVLELSAAQAVEFFTDLTDDAALHSGLRTLVDVGLGYLGVGQALSTLSGGERQRLKLATQLDRSGSIYVLDEPTTGLHTSDVDMLLALLDELVDRGNTVLVVEHNLDVVAHADWVVDLGPGGGNDGGEIVFSGTPRELLACKQSLTGRHLKRHA